MPGLLPMPDSIKGCGPECLRDSDCHYDLICNYGIQRCVEKPNPCHPSPCGPGTFCMVNHRNDAICRLKINQLACFCFAEMISCSLLLSKKNFFGNFFFFFDNTPEHQQAKQNSVLTFC